MWLNDLNNKNIFCFIKKYLWINIYWKIIFVTYFQQDLKTELIQSKLAYMNLQIQAIIQINWHINNQKLKKVSYNFI